ncbi:MAG: hypothetical protein IPP19_16255 [Verrucomicrobia bacterium]|nr:hypothetical protein [Verrucomicrobiota bacterium]
MKTSLLLTALAAIAYPSLALATPSFASLLQPEIIISSYTLAGLFFLCRTNQTRRIYFTESKAVNTRAAQKPASSATPFHATCCTTH